MAISETGMGKDPKAISGKTVLAWLVGFFGVIFAMNGVFLYFALGTFPGVAVQSSYEAGQAYNQEIEAARLQRNLNWQVTSELTRDGTSAGRLVVSAADAAAVPLSGIEILASLEHPAQVQADIDLDLRAYGGGQYVADIEDLPAGNWTLVLEINQDGERRFKSENRVFVRN